MAASDRGHIFLLVVALKMREGRPRLVADGLFLFATRTLDYRM